MAQHLCRGVGPCRRGSCSCTRTRRFGPWLGSPFRETRSKTGGGGSSIVGSSRTGGPCFSKACFMQLGFSKRPADLPSSCPPVFADPEKSKKDFCFGKKKKDSALLLWGAVLEAAGAQQDRGPSGLPALWRPGPRAASTWASPPPPPAPCPCRVLFIREQDAPSGVGEG